MKYKGHLIRLYKPEIVFDLSGCPLELIEHADEYNREIARATVRGKLLNEKIYLEYAGRNKSYKLIKKIIDELLKKEN